jgi:hypothetical protein
VRFSADMIAGSGLRDGDANISKVPPYSQFDVGIAREFLLPYDAKPVTCASMSSICSTRST